MSLSLPLEFKHVRKVNGVCAKESGLIEAGALLLASNHGEEDFQCPTGYANTDSTYRYAVHGTI